MWAKVVADGIEIHRDTEPREVDAVDVVDLRPPFNPATEELAGPTWRFEAGVVVAIYEVVPRDRERDEQAAVDARIQSLAAKARAILADPARSADWTAAERKVLLAALLLAASTIR